MNLKDQVVLVTGASQGIGRAIATRVASAGAKLIICSRTVSTIKDAERELGKTAEVQAVTADVTEENDVERLKEEALMRFGRVDAVVNNAGGAEAIPFLKTTRSDWDRMIRTNATSAFLVSRAFLPEMVERGSGRIVVIASSSSKKGAAYVAAYAAAKHAVLGLVRCLAAEFGPKGIRVNAICPGYVDTPMTRRSIDRIVQSTKRSETEARRILADMNPQKRLIRPEEVADVCLDLIAPDGTQNGEAIDL